MGLQLTLGRYAVFGTVKSSEAPVDHANGTDVGHPARDCAFCQDASRLGDAVLDSAMLHGALVAVPVIVHVVVGFSASRGLARWIASGFVARAVTFVGG